MIATLSSLRRAPWLFAVILCLAPLVLAQDEATPTDEPGLAAGEQMEAAEAARPAAAPPALAERLPPYAGELRLTDPAWAELQPEDQIRAIRKRLEQDPKSDEAPRLHLTIGHIYETEVGDLVEAAEAYNRLMPLLGKYEFAGEGVLRAAELYQKLALEADPDTAKRYLKKARRELDSITMALQRQSGEGIPLWEPTAAGWVAVDDPYGYVLLQIDQMTRDQFVYKFIDALYRVTGGVPGWSHVLGLVLLAIGLKLSMFPLSRKGYRSMAAMQKLQPQMQELQKRYKDNPQKLNEEMMRLYKEAGVNPLGGCLPMLLQMPFFILVYQGIRAYTYHYHNVEFFWIGSLAQPDTPLLLLYGVSMYFSQKIAMSRQPTPTDPNQAQMQRTMSWFMPVMFTYMMYIWKLPSAFYLYWLTFNVIATVEQFVIHRGRDESPVVVGEASRTSSTAASVTPLSVLGEESRERARNRRAGRASASKKRRRRRGG